MFQCFYRRINFSHPDRIARPPSISDCLLIDIVDIRAFDHLMKCSYLSMGRSVPDLELVKDSSLMSILRWNCKANMDRTMSSDDAHITLVMLLS